MSFLPRARNLKRYRQIITVFMQYGFREVIERTRLPTLLNLNTGNVENKDNLEELTGPERFRLALETLGPTFIKLGQILSTRPDLLPPAYIVELSHLQDSVTEMSWQTVKEAIESELRTGFDETFLFVEARPLGTASLAQVHAARLKDSTDVVIKIQRPDIEKNIRADLEILQDMARLIQTFTSLDRMWDLPAIADDFAYTLWQELDYEQEARNAETFQRNFSGDDDVRIPAIYNELSTTKMLVMERLTGIKIDDVDRIDSAGYDRPQIARKSARIIIKEVMQDGFFHADPHPGNLLVMQGGAIGVMDFGMVGWLPKRLRMNLAQLFIALANRDIEAVVTRLIQLNIASPSVERENLERDFTRLLRKYYGRSLKNIRVQDFLEDLYPMIYEHELRVPTDLWLLFKTLVIMQGVGTRLDPDFDIFLDSRPYIQRLTLQQWSPAALQETAVRTSISVSDLITTTPDLLRKVEDGRLKVQIELTGLDDVFSHISPLVTRITTAILLLGIILGISLLLPRLDSAPVWFSLIVAAMFLVAVGMSVMLAWQTIRGDR